MRSFPGLVDLSRRTGVRIFEFKRQLTHSFSRSRGNSPTEHDVSKTSIRISTVGPRVSRANSRGNGIRQVDASLETKDDRRELAIESCANGSPHRDRSGGPHDTAEGI